MTPATLRGLRPLLLVALMTPLAQARADHPFILPSSTSFSGANNVVTFDAAGSDHVFFFDHRPIQLDTIRIEKPDGTPGTPMNAVQTRFRSVLDLRLDQPGTWKVSSTQVGVGGTARINGEERRVGGRMGARPGGDPNRPGEARMPGAGPQGGAPQGGERRPPMIALADLPTDSTDVHLIETVGRVESFVTVDQPSTTVFTPTGKGLELQPITHPNAVVAGETARFRFLVDGAPAAGVKVTVIPAGDRYRDASGEIHLVTDMGGGVAVKWPAAGAYWLGAEAEDHHPADKRAETRRLTYAATLEVMTP